MIDPPNNNCANHDKMPLEQTNNKQPPLSNNNHASRQRGAPPNMKFVTYHRNTPIYYDLTNQEWYPHPPPTSVQCCSRFEPPKEPVPRPVPRRPTFEYKPIILEPQRIMWPGDTRENPIDCNQEYIWPRNVKNPYTPLDKPDLGRQPHTYRLWGEHIPKPEEPSKALVLHPLWTSEEYQKPTIRTLVDIAHVTCYLPHQYRKATLNELVALDELDRARWEQEQPQTYKEKVEHVKWMRRRWLRDF